MTETRQATLAEWLLVRIEASDEPRARTLKDMAPLLAARFGVPDSVVAYLDQTADHVLADLAAKREVVRLLVEYMEGDYAPWNELILLALAQPYADAPGWREEWRDA